MRGGRQMKKGRLYTVRKGTGAPEGRLGTGGGGNLVKQLKKGGATGC